MNDEMTQYSNAQEQFTDQELSVGEILRRARVQYGRTLDEVEAVLRIRASQLDALECDDTSNLPGRVYAIGFIRSYAEYLGLDGDKIVHLYKQQLGHRPARPEYTFPVAVHDSRRPGFYIFILSLIGLGFVFFSYFNWYQPASSLVVSEAVTEKPASPGAELKLASQWPPSVDTVMPEMANLISKFSNDDEASTYIEAENTDSELLIATNLSSAGVETSDSVSSNTLLASSRIPSPDDVVNMPVSPEIVAERSHLMEEETSVNEEDVAPFSNTVIAENAELSVMPLTAREPVEITTQEKQAPVQKAAATTEDSVQAKIKAEEVVWSSNRKRMHAADDVEGNQYSRKRNAVRSTEDIRVIAVDPTWLQIKDGDGDIVFTGILRPGKDIKVPHNAYGWRMDIGNAGGVDIYVGNQKMPSLGEDGLVVRKISLLSRELRARFQR